MKTKVFSQNPPGLYFGLCFFFLIADCSGMILKSYSHTYTPGAYSHTYIRGYFMSTVHTYGAITYGATLLLPYIRGHPCPPYDFILYRSGIQYVLQHPNILLLAPTRSIQYSSIRSSCWWRQLMANTTLAHSGAPPSLKTKRQIQSTNFGGGGGFRKCIKVAGLK